MTDQQDQQFLEFFRRVLNNQDLELQQTFQTKKGIVGILSDGEARGLHDGEVYIGIQLTDGRYWSQRNPAQPDHLIDLLQVWAG
ncbi:hypothetical protein KSF_107680 [Reticulibacter mediterranei]|uniref:Uncharacterized protein n=1 Tax=Reticulibacter mediterranei TaxID=2778369 RepID=A0A8J3N9L4_9CHLR|nr:hypothetical protein [Reticulibacter mediterranei]GHP00721.1 hypothetical protein KSF_107680 [Reticulibacter mediterranei]